MRRRMLNPDFFTDPDIVASLDAYGRLLYQGMWCVADDSGCFELNPLLFKMKVLPGDENITSEDIQEYIDTLISKKKIIPYEVDGKKYGWLKNFNKHQSLNKPNSPSVPLPSWITWHGEDEYKDKRHKYYYEINYNNTLNNNEKTEDSQCLSNGQTQDRPGKENSLQEEKLKEVKRREVKRKENNNTAAVVEEEAREKKEESADDRSDIPEFYQKTFGKIISPHQSEVLQTYIGDGMSEEVILLALKEAAMANASSLNYVIEILNSWANRNIKTVKQAKQAIKEFKNSKKSANGKSNYKGPPPRKSMEELKASGYN